MTALSVGICVLAKYYKDYNIKNDISTIKAADYYFDMINAESKTKPLEAISLQNLNPGETKQIVFMVRNGSEKDGRKVLSDVNIVYDIEIIHTKNLPLTYKVYDENGIELVNTVVTDNSQGNDYLNLGKSILYSKDNESKELVLEKSNGNINYKQYILEINWNINDNDSKYVKEIDALYLKVTSYEQKPVQ